MGKPFDHQYYFASGSEYGCSVGEMVCAHCHKPVDSQKQDWMSWKKFKGGDWGYLTAHRSCVVDQTGWESQIKARLSAEKKYKSLVHDLQALAAKHQVTDAYSFADAAADALGACIDDFLS